MNLSPADYFARNIGILTTEAQDTLANSTVAIIGCGGLGGYVIEHLARMGFGRLRLADPDVFSVSNCNRQLNALSSTLGQGKAEVAARRVADIHPFCHAAVFPADFRHTDVLLGATLVLDCLDDTQARRDLAVACSERNLPLVHGSVRGWCGQVGVQLPGGNLYDRLYPRRPGRQTTPPPVLSVTVGVVSAMQAAEALKLALGHPSHLHNAWLYLDLRHGDFLVTTTEANA